MTKELDVFEMWATKAENDFKAAQLLIGATDAAFYDAACFHAQQCAEKYIKGLLARNKIAFKKSHDLGELLSLLPADARPAVDLTELERLTGYAVVPRYPGFGEEMTMEDAVEAVRSAERIKKAVMSRTA